MLLISNITVHGMTSMLFNALLLKYETVSCQESKILRILLLLEKEVTALGSHRFQVDTGLTLTNLCRFVRDLKN